MTDESNNFKAGDRVVHFATTDEEGTVVGHEEGFVLVVFDDTPYDTESHSSDHLSKVE